MSSSDLALSYSKILYLLKVALMLVCQQSRWTEKDTGEQSRHCREELRIHLRAILIVQGVVSNYRKQLNLLLAFPALMFLHRLSQELDHLKNIHALVHIVDPIFFHEFHQSAFDVATFSVSIVNESSRTIHNFFGYNFVVLVFVKYP